MHNGYNSVTRNKNSYISIVYKGLLIFFLVATCSNYIFSQDAGIDSTENEGKKYVVFFPSSELTQEIDRWLRAWEALIKLRVHPLVNLNEEQYKRFSNLMDSVRMMDNASITDSISIILKSGLSWRLAKGYPPQPKYFYFKVLTKKGKKVKAVADRLKYLQFCYAFKEHSELPHDLIEKFNCYYAISIDGEKRFDMVFEIKFTEEGRTKTISREINFYNSF